MINIKIKKEFNQNINRKYELVFILKTAYFFSFNSIFIYYKAIFPISKFFMKNKNLFFNPKKLINIFKIILFDVFIILIYRFLLTCRKE